MKKRISVLTALAAFLMLIFASDSAIAGCRYGLRLCAELIIPTLFPFFVLSILLNILGLPAYMGKLLSPAAAKLYGISGAGASALIIGLTGGYPLGAAYIADMERHGAIDAAEGERLLAFCNNSGPAFIIGAVGAGIFHSGKIGIVLYLIHILSASLTGLFFRGPYASAPLTPLRIDEPVPAQALVEAVRRALESILSVCGFVIIFTVFTGMLDARGNLSLLCGHLSEKTGLELHFTRALITGLLELGSGVGAMQGLGASPSTMALAAGLISWGGISVQLQTASVLYKSKIKGTLHMAGHLISALIASILAYCAGVVLL